MPPAQCERLTLQPGRVFRILSCRGHSPIVEARGREPGFSESFRGASLRWIVRPIAFILALGMASPAGVADSSSGPAIFAPHGLSAARYTTDLQSETLRILADDRIELVATLSWRGALDDPAWARPVILIPSPYEFVGYETMGPDEAAASGFHTGLVDHFTRRGYAVAVADVRGTGRSGGCQDIVGPKTVQDFADWVAFLAGMRWSNGKVGAFGGSYLGQIVKAGLGHAPPSLRTAAVYSALTSEYEALATAGVPYWYWDTSLFELAALAAPAVLPSKHAPHVDAGRVRCAGETASVITVNGDYTPFFELRDSRRRIGGIRASVLEMHGLKGPPYFAFEAWFDDLPAFHRGIYGQWGHEVPHRADLMPTLHAWFDAELLDLPTGIEEWPALQVQAEDGKWRAVPSFAGMSSVGASYRLLGDGALGHGTAGGGVSWREFDAPTDGRPSLIHELSSGRGPPEGWTAELLRGEVAFRSQPLPAVHLSGVAELTAPIKIDRDDAHFVIRIDAVAPDGSAHTLTRGALSASHRNSLVQQERVPLNRWVTYRIRTQPFDALLTEGTRLELRIAGGDDWFMPQGNEYTGTVATDGSAVLTIPIADDSCGLSVAGDAAAPCPGGPPT